MYILIKTVSYNCRYNASIEIVKIVDDPIDITKKELIENYLNTFENLKDWYRYETLAEHIRIHVENIDITKIDDISKHYCHIIYFLYLMKNGTFPRLEFTNDHLLTTEKGLQFTGRIMNLFAFLSLTKIFDKNVMEKITTYIEG